MNRLHSFAGTATALAMAVFSAVPAVPALASDAGLSGLEEAIFSLDARSEGTLRVQEQVTDSRDKKIREQQQIAVMVAPGGDVAIVDESMADYGALSAANSRFVDLDWVDVSGASGYTVSRDDRIVATLPARTSAFRDAKVKPGAHYRYKIEPVTDGDAVAVGEAQMWSFKVRVPEASDKKSLEAAASAQALAASVASTSTVSWVTFIPVAKVDAPPAGCTYGSGYQFGGDNRSYDWTSSRYRTALNATVTWSTKAVSGSASARPTTVYRKSTGALVATRTASMANSYARKLGSGSNYADLRFVVHAGNPFCSANAISGAFSMHLTQSGNYSFISGNHRQAPNHHVFIYDGGGVTDVYRRNNAGFICLAGSALCAYANFYGSGSF